MRCKCCDAIMTTVEMTRLRPNGEYEDLCSECGRIVFLDVENIFVEQREYAFGHLTEGILSCTNYEFKDGLGSDPSLDDIY